MNSILTRHFVGICDPVSPLKICWFEHDFGLASSCSCIIYSLIGMANHHRFPWNLKAVRLCVSLSLRNFQIDEWHTYDLCWKYTSGAATQYAYMLFANATKGQVFFIDNHNQCILHWNDKIWGVVNQNCCLSLLNYVSTVFLVMFVRPRLLWLLNC